MEGDLGIVPGEVDNAGAEVFVAGFDQAILEGEEGPCGSEVETGVGWLPEGEEFAGVGGDGGNYLFSGGLARFLEGDYVWFFDEEGGGGAVVVTVVGFP